MYNTHISIPGASFEQKEVLELKRVFGLEKGERATTTRQEINTIHFGGAFVCGFAFSFGGSSL